MEGSPLADEAVGRGVSVAAASVGELARQDGIGRELASTTEMAEGGGGQVEEEDGGRQASLPTWWLIFLNSYNIPFSFGNGLVQQLIFLKVLSVAGVDNAPAFQGQLTLWTGLIAHINMVIVRSPHWHAAASPCSLGTCIWRRSRPCPALPACPDSPPPTDGPDGGGRRRAGGATLASAAAGASVAASAAAAPSSSSATS